MMSKSTSWRWLTAVIVLLTALIAGCQGESPTSPPPPAPGPNPPVSSPVITISISNKTPAAGQTTTIEVTATKDGQNVPDGTPIEFLTSLGTFVESGFRSLFVTSVGGKATATLTSAEGGTAEIAVRVLDTIKRDTVVFGDPIAPPTVVVLTVSEPNPAPGGSTIITATVSQEGVLVPNGTIVEFTTNFGVFTDTQTQTATRTTTAGVATVTLTSSAGGAATVTARARNAAGTLLGQSSTTIVFQAGQAPTVTSITPTTGSPAGNELVTIRGSNFIAPVRVFFDTKEAVVVSVTPTEIVVLTPAIDLGASTPTKEVTITVVNQAGTALETSITISQTFTFTIPILTPIVYGVSPSSGPNEGNTQITIAGEQFQSPVKVFFAAQGQETEVELKHVTFNQLTAVTPPAVGFGVHLLNQTVTMRVVNVNSNKSVTFTNAFRYGPEMFITSAGPLQGTTQGGTQVTIHGFGFDDPVDVVIGGIVAQPTEVTGTRIVAITGTPFVTGCSNVSGPISVTNRETGETAVAEGLTFTFLAPRPTFVSLTPNPVVEGATVSIVLEDAGAGLFRFQIGGVTVVATATSVSGDLTTFTMTAPLGLEFDEIRCGTNNLGRQFAPFVANVVFTNLTTGCTVTLADALVINPTNLACRFANASPSTNAITINDSVAGAGGTNATFTMSNTGQTDLTASPSISSACATGTFAIAPTGTSTIPPASSQVYTVTFTATAVGPCGATITWTTNDPDPSSPPTTITVTGNGTP